MSIGRLRRRRAVQAALTTGINIGLSSAACTVVQGSTTTLTVTLTRIGGYTDTVTPSVSGLPTGVTGAWSDSSLSGADSTTVLTLTAAADAPTVTADAFVITCSGSEVSDAVAAATATVQAAAAGWNVVKSFEGGSNGAMSTAALGGTHTGSGTTFTNEQVYEGSLAGRMSIADGSEGFGEWGGIVDFPSPVAKGGDVWVQLYLRIPAAFQIDTINGGGPAANGSLKYLRVAQDPNGAGASGYFDLQLIDDAFSDTWNLRMIKENQVTDWQYFGPDGTIVRDQWMRHTLHMHLDDVLPAFGGTSRIRFWQDGVLLVDSATIQPIVNAAHTCTALYIFTYFNGASTQDQHLYVDDIRVSSSTVPSWATGLEGV